MLFRSFYLFSVLARILPFVGTHTDCTLFRYSSGQFFGTGMDSYFSRYSLVFYHFWVPTLIVPFFRYSSRQFFGTHPDSNFSRYSPAFYHICVLTHIVPFSDTRLDTFSVLARILPFVGTHTDCTLFRYSSGHVFGDRKSVV